MGHKNIYQILIIYLAIISGLSHTYAQDSLNVKTLEPQIEVEAKKLMQALMPKQGVSQSVKITLTNNSEKPKLIYLRNDPKITGFNTKGLSFIHPLNLLGEQCASINDETLPVFFADWFKVIKPNQQFVFYFHSCSDIDVDGIIKLIKHVDLIPEYIENRFEWPDNEIIIHLPLWKGQ